MATKTSEKALRLIKKAAEEKAEFLDLGNCELTAVPPGILDLAPWLRGVNFGSYYRDQDSLEYVDSKNGGRGNNIGSEIGSLSILENLPLITVLYLGGNSVGHVGAESLSRLSQLTTLDVSDNSIGDQGAESLSRLSQLTTLDVSGNSIGEQGAESLSSLSQLATLDVSGNSIGEQGAESLSHLNQLTTLYVSHNSIGEQGAESLSRLSQLTTLHASYNSIGDQGAESLSSLSQLTTLDISVNSIGDQGAESLSRLSQLTTLDVSGNSIGEQGAESLSRLSQLVTLDVSGNFIGDRGAESLSRLSQLTNLDVSYNSIGNQGAEFLRKLNKLLVLYVNANRIGDMGIIRLSEISSLAGLYAGGNPIHQIPASILDDLAALRSYFAATERQPNTVVKMTLAGNTEAGKTSLAKWLTDGKYPPEAHELKTHGIRHWEWKVHGLGTPLKVNILDFGGQDYYHATHNLFLDNDSLHLVLWNTQQSKLEEGQDFPLEYWLGNVRHYSAEAPLMVAQTKGDQEERQWLGTEVLKEYDLKGQFYLSVEGAFKREKESVWEDEFNYFKAHILEQFRDLLRRSNPMIPKAWRQLRDGLLPRLRSRKILAIPLDELKVKCLRSLKHLPEEIRKRELAFEAMLPYLVSCGEVIHFRDIPSLREHVFVSPEKLTGKIYELLSQEVRSMGGRLDSVLLKEKFGNDALLMLDLLKAYQLIFPEPGKEGVYVAPQYLPENPQVRHFAALIPVSFILRFKDFLSRGLIAAFITRYAGSVQDSFYWRYGAFFKLRDLNTFVRIDESRLQVWVHVEDKRGKYEVMREILWFFGAENSRGREKALLPTERESVETEKLKVLEKAPLKPLLQYSPDGKRYVSIGQIQEALQLRQPNIRTTDNDMLDVTAQMHQLFGDHHMSPKKIFLSYSHADESYKAELDKHFAALKRSGKVETWNDRAIASGQDWEKEIMDNMARADIVLLLLSSDFMDSWYIWNKEQPEAIQQGKVVIPIFLRHCDFEEELFKIHKIQGVPRDDRANQRQWITDKNWSSRDEAYLKVIQEIKKYL